MTSARLLALSLIGLTAVSCGGSSNSPTSPSNPFIPGGNGYQSAPVCTSEYPPVAGQYTSTATVQPQVTTASPVTYLSVSGTNGQGIGSATITWAEADASLDVAVAERDTSQPGSFGRQIATGVLTAAQKIQTCWDQPLGAGRSIRVTLTKGAKASLTATVSWPDK